MVVESQLLPTLVHLGPMHLRKYTCVFFNFPFQIIYQILLYQFFFSFFICTYFKVSQKLGTFPLVNIIFFIFYFVFLLFLFIYVYYKKWFVFGKLILRCHILRPFNFLFKIPRPREVTFHPFCLRSKIKSFKYLKTYLMKKQTLLKFFAAKNLQLGGKMFIGIF